MTTSQFDEPGSEATARAAQMTAMGVTVLEALARLRLMHGQELVAADERTASAARQQRLAEHATARLAWTPAFDDDWLRRASTVELGQAWAAAMPWAHTDREAAKASERVETRLAVLHPEAMTAYHLARAGGASWGEAMTEAGPLFAQRPALSSALSRHEQASGRPVREPRVIADDAYPYPTSQAVATAARTREGVHVVTTAAATTRHTARAAAAR
jgi:hypothetical protein